MIEAWAAQTVLKRIVFGAATAAIALVASRGPQLSADLAVFGIRFVFEITDPAKFQLALLAATFSVLTELRHAVADRYPAIGRFIA